MNENRTIEDGNPEEIDLLDLFNTLWTKKYIIVLCCLIFSFIGLFFALSKQTNYEADLLIQIEKEKPSLSSITNFSEMLSNEPESSAELEIIKSRTIIGEAVKSLNLQTQVTKKSIPVIGKLISNFSDYSDAYENNLKYFWGKGYAWGDEDIVVSKFEVPNRYIDRKFGLEIDASNWVLSIDGQVVLSGDVGVLSKNDEFSLLVKVNKLHHKLSLVLLKQPLNTVVLDYQNKIQATLKAKSKKIIRLSYTSNDPNEAVRVLNQISNIYLDKNIQRSSAEIQGSLSFLQKKLPSVKASLEQSELKLNDFQAKSGSIDISSEAKVVLEQIVEIENKLAELQLKKTELDKKFTANHPNYKAWLSQKHQMQKTKSALEEKVKGLPKTQQDIVRLMRDVKVGNQIYLSMLNTIQELDIAKAGTVGNVQVLDKALAYPVSPKKPLIVLMFSFLGLLTPSAIILLRKFLNKGITSDDDLEKMHLPVYAVVPYSNIQDKILDKKKRKIKNISDKRILALEYENDISVEALRSLRTSLHFAMLEAKNNVIMLTGPCPDVGKTFVSCNLAALIPTSGKRTLLIDADLRRGTIHKELNIPNTIGLADLLSRDKEFIEVVSKDTAGVKGFDVITRGSSPPNPSELLMGETFTSLISFASENYDLVIVDTPPVLSVTDASIVGNLCGTNMLVVKHLHTTKKEIKIAISNLDKAGIRIKGTILNRFKQQESAHQYHYSYDSKD